MDENRGQSRSQRRENRGVQSADTQLLQPVQQSTGKSGERKPDRAKPGHRLQTAANQAGGDENSLQGGHAEGADSGQRGKLL